jgi:hypothetical protein
MRIGKGTAAMKMKRIYFICMLAAISLFLYAGQSFAGPFGINITAWDKMGNLGEDNEVEPNDVLAQKWDLEGFYLKGNSLTMIGGFDFLHGAFDGSHTWLSGDIFISTTGTARYGDNPHASESYNSNEPNIFGYNYVLDMDYTNQSYQVYRIDQSAIVSDVYYHENVGSNPYRYVSGGTSIGGAHLFQYSTNPDLTDLGLLGMNGDNFHNSLTVDLGFLPDNAYFLAHFAEQCGNDSMVGLGQAPGGSQTPEPTTIVMVGGGLIGIIMSRRLKRSRQKFTS